MNRASPSREPPQHRIDAVVAFLRRTYDAHNASAVIGVSGGIDSALALTLLCRALSPARVFPVLLPYHGQAMDDAVAICAWNDIPLSQCTTVNIGPLADAVFTELGIETAATVRRGNVMARVRMITLYDIAKRKAALVCGTENKSEKSLGYFTRFGDGASDVEPIQHLYKTGVRVLATALALPQSIITKAPTAGLWEGQTDEQELGFTYAEADRVLEASLDRGLSREQIMEKGISAMTVDAVLERVENQRFKHAVPYILE